MPVLSDIAPPYRRPDAIDVCRNELTCRVATLILVFGEMICIVIGIFAVHDGQMEFLRSSTIRLRRSKHFDSGIYNCLIPFEVTYGSLDDHLNRVEEPGVHNRLCRSNKGTGQIWHDALEIDCK